MLKTKQVSAIQNMLKKFQGLTVPPDPQLCFTACILCLFFEKLNLLHKKTARAISAQNKP